MSSLAVLGSQYQPQSRPPSGRPLSGKSVSGTSRPASHGEIISQKQREDLLFEEFIASQERFIHTTEGELKKKKKNKEGKLGEVVGMGLPILRDLLIFVKAKGETLWY